MQNIALQDVSVAVAKNRRKSIWKRIVSVLACIVVFCTTYALILPALTLERDPSCGIEEHTHTEACYVKEETPTEQVLVCTAETLGLHIHTDACIGLDGEYICGYSDFVVHSHNEFCFDENGVPFRRYSRTHIQTAAILCPTSIRCFPASLAASRIP